MEIESKSYSKNLQSQQNMDYFFILTLNNRKKNTNISKTQKKTSNAIFSNFQTNQSIIKKKTQETKISIPNEKFIFTSRANTLFPTPRQKQSTGNTAIVFHRRNAAKQHSAPFVATTRGNYTMHTHNRCRKNAKHTHKHAGARHAVFSCCRRANANAIRNMHI